MRIKTNPFTPTFGTVPEYMAGRDRILGDMGQAFAGGYGNPNLSTILVGARGTGKTALMSCIRDEALRTGWIAIGTTALPGMLEDLYEQAILTTQHLVEQESSRHLTSLSVGPVSAGWEGDATQPQGNWRTRMTKLLDQLAQIDTGLLITVDEVQTGIDELVLLAAVYQHFVTERRKVSLVMAGLPYHVHRLVSNKSVSFLRRSTQHQLGRIPDADVGRALRKTINGSGKKIDPDALGLCVRAIEGFAFMLQLVGYRAWMESDASPTITLEHAHQGIADARSDMEQYVLASTYRELSNGDVRFLEAMLEDPRESRLSVIAKRMGVSAGYASKYKSRLLASGVIGEVARGVVAMDVPGMREYVARSGVLRG